MLLLLLVIMVIAITYTSKSSKRETNNTNTPYYDLPGPGPAGGVHVLREDAEHGDPEHVARPRLDNDKCDNNSKNDKYC